MSQYYISGVFKDDNGVITNLLVHLGGKEHGQNVFYQGHKNSVNEVIDLLQENEVNAMVWNYEQSSWYIHQSVGLVDADPPYLRTHVDGVITNNLE